MGLPLGWGFLSLLHIHIVEEAHRLTDVSEKTTWVRILGDDLIAYWPKITNEKYNELLKNYGMEISVDKHQVSRKIGEFARVQIIPSGWKKPIYRVTEDPEQLLIDGVVEELVGYQVTFIPQDCLTVGMFSRTRNSEIDLLFAAAQQSNAYRGTKQYSKFRDALYLAHTNIDKMSTKHGILPHVPVIGLGLPNRKGHPDKVGCNNIKNYYSYKYALEQGFGI